MQTTLEQAIEIVNSLPYEDRENLRKWLDEKDTNDLLAKNVSQKRMDWIKANREKYARQYVALIENQNGEIELIATGKTHKQAKENSIEKGVENPFITFFYSENDIPFGGW
jgi:hypothetical protein